MAFEDSHGEGVKRFTVHACASWGALGHQGGIRRALPLLNHGAGGCDGEARRGGESYGEVMGD